VTSEGGIAGRGVGGITIDDAKIAASDMRRTCGSTLSNDERAELQSLTSIVAHETTEPARPDQIRYTLSVGDVRASWYGEEPPADVAAMFKALWRIRARVLSGC
jgi:hypothetical protein